MGKVWRLILDEKHDGYYNMAVDEAILFNYLSRKTPTLRIYGWIAPFITLGYKQNPQEVLKVKQKFPFTRRVTGGFSILHHQEITYSIVCSLKDLNLSLGVKQSYQKLCQFLIYFYCQLGLKPEFAQKRKINFSQSSANFCFSSWEFFDLLINNKKIGGNAQRRKKDIIFQHGSIPQEISFKAIARAIRKSGNLQDKTISLNTALNRKTNFNRLSLSLSESFQRVFAIEFVQEGLSGEEIRFARYLAENKYRDKAWKINRRFNLRNICKSHTG